MTQPLTLTQSYKTTEELVAHYGAQVLNIHNEMEAGKSEGAEFLGGRTFRMNFLN